jgi:NADP-dependent 3-hydroxy acid dehydrogenase YdfG
MFLLFTSIVYVYHAQAISPGMVETEFLQVSMGQEKSDEVYTKIKALQSLDLAQLIVQVLSAPPHMEVIIIS